MGSSIYQVGYQPAWFGGGVQSEIGELPVLAEAWNEARTLALSRLAQEAQRAGADAVVGVDLRAGSDGIAAATGVQSIEYNVFGTAVKRGDAAAGPPVITELSVADYLKLVDAGIEPVGVVAWTSVFFVSSLFIRSEQPTITGTSWRNYELRGVTECFYSAREQVVEQIGAQARQLRASGIVGVRIGHSAVPHTIGAGGYGQQERSVVMVTMSAIGTAIRGDAASAGSPTDAGDTQAGGRPHAGARLHAHADGHAHDGSLGGNRRAFPLPKLKIDLSS